jgi:hypothetical protein
VSAVITSTPAANTNELAGIGNTSKVSLAAFVVEEKSTTSDITRGILEPLSEGRLVEVTLLL